MKIATCSYDPHWCASDKVLRARLLDWMTQASSQGAEILLMPEYAGCEAALTTETSPDLDARGWAAAMSHRANNFAQLNAELAQELGVWIIAGSLCATDSRGALVNRAYVASPSGTIDWQDKLIPTPYERREMGVTGGETLRLFSAPWGKFGVLICYDSEFPILARALIEAGASVIFVPSQTDLPAGQTRVRQSCRARAIEGQCLVVQAPVLGRLSDCEILESGTGRAAIFCPPDLGFPDDGIIAQGKSDTPQWVIAEVDLSGISRARETGQVENVRHWSEQDDRVKQVTICKIT